MTKTPEGLDGPSNVSDGFMKRLAAQRASRDAQDATALDVLTTHLWQRIVDVHRATSIERLAEIKERVERIDGSILAMVTDPPSQETLKRIVKEALQSSAQFLPQCQPNEKDEGYIAETKRDVAGKIVTMRIRAVVAFESYTLGESRGPEKLSSVLRELVKANLIYREEVPIITEAIYPKDTEVVSF